MYSMNIESNQKELKTVNAVYRGETNEIYEITIENQIIRATSRHKFHTLDRGWIEANALREGEEITNKSGKNLRVTKIEKKIHEKPIRIYDLTIDKYHNYLFMCLTFLPLFFYIFWLLSESRIYRQIAILVYNV